MSFKYFIDYLVIAQSLKFEIKKILDTFFITNLRRLLNKLEPHKFKNF